MKRVNSLFPAESFEMAGFTLVELLVSLVVGSILTIAIYSSYTLQQRSSVVQENVTRMQQNLRAGLMMLERDIRMAGLDPTNSGKFGFTEAHSSAVIFTADLNGDGEPDDSGENIGYDIYTPASSSVSTLGRSSSSSVLTISADKKNVSGHEPLAEDIERLEFYYQLEDNSGNVSQTTSPASAELGDIRSIQISVLARSSRPDPDFANSVTYTSASGASWTFNDNYRRRLLITTIQCRNMGLD